MKRKTIISIILAACFMICAAALCVSAADEKIMTSKNGLYRYTLDENNKATIVAYSGTDETVITISRIDGKYAVGAIGDSVFAASTTLKEVTIYSSVTKIGAGAFMGCTSLEKINFHGNCNITEIGDDAFYGCTALKEFKIAKSIKTIGASAFQNCTSVSLDFSDASSLTSIGSYAFAECATASGNKFAVEIPASLTDIGYGAFYGCSGITSFWVENGNTKFSSEDGVLYSENGGVLEMFPVSSSAINDGAFTVPSHVKKIKGGAFAGITGLEKLVISEGTTEIGGNSIFRIW